MKAGPSDTQDQDVVSKRRRVMEGSGDASSAIDSMQEIEHYIEPKDPNKSAVELPDIDEDTYTPSDDIDKLVDFQSSADLLSGIATSSK